MAAASARGSYQEKCALAVRPPAAGHRLDRLHRDVAFLAHRQQLLDVGPVHLVLAAAGSCTGTAPSRSRSARGSAACIAGDAQAVPGDAHEARQALRREPAPAPRRAPPEPKATSHSSGSTRLCSWIRSTWSTPSRSSDRSRLGPRRVAAAIAGLGGDEELAGVRRQPRRHAQLGITVGGGHVEVVDARLEQHRQQRVGRLLAHRRKRGATEDDPAALVARTSECGAVDHAGQG